MQITHTAVIPMELDLRTPLRTAYTGEDAITRIGAVFVRLETRQGDVAWGCAAVGTMPTGETLESVTQACRACADLAPDLNPLNMEHALFELARLTEGTPAALCAFDIAFHDLLGLATGQPLYRLLGGYRDRIQTSITVGLGSVQETVAMARGRARQGFRILKIKGGLDAEEDVRRVHAVYAALPNITLRLDADEGYTVEEALAVARALRGQLEMLEQPLPISAGLSALRQITTQSAIPILADQSAVDPASALEIAGQHAADGLSIKLATCGGIHCARQMDAIARAAHIATMVGCVYEPALLIAAELAFALSSPAVRYGDLDGHFDLERDPTNASFIVRDGWLIATNTPGLGCTVQL